MARRRKDMGQTYIEADNGFGWTRKRASLESVEPNKWVITVFGVTYELEKRCRNILDGAYDTGWYLYSSGVSDGFFGEWCGSLTLPAVDVASEMIAKADLRGEGYEKEEA